MDNFKQETKEAVSFYMSSRYGLTESDWGDAFDANWIAGETAEEWAKAYWDMKNDAEYQKASEAGRNLEVTLSLDNGHVIVHRYWVDEEGCLCETLPHDGEEDSHTVSFHMKGGHEFHCQGSGDDWRKLESNGAIEDIVRALLCESG